MHETDRTNAVALMVRFERPHVIQEFIEYKREGDDWDKVGERVRERISQQCQVKSFNPIHQYRDENRFTKYFCYYMTQEDVDKLNKGAYSEVLGRGSSGVPGYLDTELDGYDYLD